MGLFEIQAAAFHGTNQSIWIDLDKICSVEQRSGAALITFIGGSQVSVAYFQSFPRFVRTLLANQQPGQS